MQPVFEPAERVTFSRDDYIPSNSRYARHPPVVREMENTLFSLWHRMLNNYPSYADICARWRSRGSN